MIKAAIFDLDGTLLDTLADIAAAGNAALRDVGLVPHSTEEFRAAVGGGVEELARRLFPPSRHTEKDFSDFARLYRHHYAERWHLTSKPYPGLVEVLLDAQSRGIRLAVLSNKREDFTKLCVEKLLPEIRFSEVRGARSGVPLKPDPAPLMDIVRTLQAEPHECLYIGDSEIDIETARGAAVPCAIVTWGFRDREFLAAHGATLFIDSPEELTRFLR